MTVNAAASRTADDTASRVLVIGDGVIGLSTALELCRQGTTCRVVGARREGIASGAAAGLLAPSVGSLAADVRPFFDDSLARYPAFVEALRPYEPTLKLLTGLIDLSRRDGGDALGARLTREELHTLEPGARASDDARYFADDGAVDNVALLRALRRAVEAAPEARTTYDDPVSTISLGGREIVVQLESGRRLSTDIVVVAAGAWSSRIAGLPRPLPVSPLKGQMLAVASTALRHPIMGDDVYVVPRGGELAIGATVEHAGFDLQIDADAIEILRRAAIGVCPAVESAPVLRTWAGVRPATPDMLPIIGADPDEPRVIYACGHSKNGILLAPATAVAVAALATGGKPPVSVGPFAVSRFGN